MDTELLFNTDFLSEINWLAVLLAALAYFLLGAIWYSKILFANKWIAYTKINMADPNISKGVAGIMFASFIWMFIISLGLAILRAKLDTSGWMSGLKTGLFTGLFFGAAAISISYLYEKRPFGLHLINNGYTILGNIVAAIIIFSWA